MTYTLGAGTPRSWTITTRNVDTTHSMPMVMSSHFMDTIFDGGTPGTSIPPHNNHGVMALSPEPTADFSGGRVLHLTMEVDGRFTIRRWVTFNLSPANDPLTNWYGNSTLNRSSHAFFVQFFPGKVTTDVFTGTTPDGAAVSFPVTGAAGQAPVSGDNSLHFGGNGIGLDNRSRYDLYTTTTHFAVFQDGVLLTQADIPHGGLPFDNAKVYYTHYLYHTANDINELKTYAPWEHYWIDHYHWSDERHWNNMGFEVLPASDVPASNDFASFASDIHMPVAQAPTLLGAAVPLVSPLSSAPSATAIPVAPRTMAPAPATATPVPAVPTATLSPTPSPAPSPTNLAVVVPPAASATMATPPAPTKARLAVSAGLASGSSAYGGQANVVISNGAPLTNLKVMVTVQRSSGLDYGGQFSAMPPKLGTVSHAVYGSKLVYTYTMSPGQMLPRARVGSSPLSSSAPGRPIRPGTTATRQSRRPATRRSRRAGTSSPVPDPSPAVQRNQPAHGTVPRAGCLHRCPGTPTLPRAHEHERAASTLLHVVRCGGQVVAGQARQGHR